MNPRHDPILARLRHALSETYGSRVERVILFGSHARGDARPDSDYDVAVFISEPGGLWDELGILAHITTNILEETGAVISAKPFPAGSYRGDLLSCTRYVVTDTTWEARIYTFLGEGTSVSRGHRAISADSAAYRRS